MKGQNNKNHLRHSANQTAPNSAALPSQGTSLRHKLSTQKSYTNQVRHNIPKQPGQKLEVQVKKIKDKKLHPKEPTQGASGDGREINLEVKINGTNIASIEAEQRCP